MRADRLRLLDALEQIELIRTFSASGRETFFGNILTQSARFCTGWPCLARLAAAYPRNFGKLTPKSHGTRSLLFAIWWSTNTLASTSISSGQSLPSKSARLAPRSILSCTHCRNECTVLGHNAESVLLASCHYESPVSFRVGDNSLETATSNHRAFCVPMPGTVQATVRLQGGEQFLDHTEDS
jgi:hypothetical protein